MPKATEPGRRPRGNGPIPWFLALIPVRYPHDVLPMPVRHTRTSTDFPSSSVLASIMIVPVDYIANIDRCPPDLGLCSSGVNIDLYDILL